MKISVLALVFAGSSVWAQNTAGGIGEEPAHRGTESQPSSVSSDKRGNT